MVLLLVRSTYKLTHYIDNINSHGIIYIGKPFHNDVKKLEL